MNDHTQQSTVTITLEEFDRLRKDSEELYRLQSENVITVSIFDNYRARGSFNNRQYYEFPRTTVNFKENKEYEEAIKKKFDLVVKSAEQFKEETDRTIETLMTVNNYFRKPSSALVRMYRAWKNVYISKKETS